MPPKKTKKTKKTKSTLKSPTLSEEFTNRVSEAPSWPSVIEVIRSQYKLPDLSTRRGLKECYKTIDIVCKTLSDGFAQSEPYPRLRGGIIGIWGKLGSDGIICDKLVAEGILPKVVEMMNNPEINMIVLRTLATVTRHGGVNTRHEVARIATPDLVKTLRENSSSEIIADLVVTILAHTVAPLYMDTTPLFRKFPTVNIGDVIQVTTSSLASAPINSHFLSHGQEVITSAAGHAYAILEKHQPALDFIVATLRVPDLRTRAVSLLGLLTFHLHHHEMDKRQLDPTKRMLGIKNLPYHLQDVIMEYGIEKSDSYLSIKASGEFQNAQMRAAQTRNFVELGLKLGEIVLLTDNSVAEGTFQDENGQSVDVGLPYSDFMGSMPVAAAALRQRDPAKYADIADMIEIKYFMARRKYEQLRSMCEAAMKRTEHAYWYYMRSNGINHDGSSGLRWAKLGLKCVGINDYLRYGLLERAAKSAAGDALDAMQDEHATADSWNLAVALFHSALEDSLAFVNEAPPDCRGMQDMATLALLLTLVLKGKDVSPDMRELKTLREKLKFSDEFSTLLRSGVILTQWRRSLNTVLERYERAANFWDSRLATCEKAASGQKPGTGDRSENPDDLAEWLSTVILEDGKKAVDADCGHGSDQSAGTPFIDGKVVFLYHCSFCRMTSASLKKCGGCGKTRYCDASCQKRHWKAHKASCGQKAPSAA